MICVSITVTGMVQGVGYRNFCYKNAKILGLNGYTENLYNGNVKIEVEGDEGLINEFIKELKIGPVYSDVKKVIVENKKYTGQFTNFIIK
jgi:acylphosphatase